MRIFAYDRFKPGVSHSRRSSPYFSEEVANVWRLWKAGIVRDNYARADEPGDVNSCSSSTASKRPSATPTTSR